MKQIVIRLVLLIVVFTPMAALASDTEQLVAKVQAALPPHLGACVLAMDEGHVVFEHGFGISDIKTKRPCTPETNFRLASVTKQFTAATVLILVDRGKLSLDDTLLKFFPGFPEYGGKITVKHLLTHTFRPASV